MLKLKLLKPVAIILSICFWLVFSLLSALPDTRLHLSFFDVGQGDAIFIRTPQNHQILIDGGPNDAVMKSLQKAMPLFDDTIDLVVLTHPHSDHLNGLTEVLKHYQVDYVLLSGVSFSDGRYDEFLSELKSSGSNLLFAKIPMIFDFGNFNFEVLYPFSSMTDQEIENLNNSSVVLRGNYFDKNFLFMGDLESDFENELALKKTDLLKLGHHGSTTSSSLSFLQKALPKYAVISVGANNKFGHPAEETILNLYRIGVDKIYRTDFNGTVEFIY